MGKLIAFRLTEKRAQLLLKAQKRLKEKNVSRLIEKALEHLVQEKDYSAKIEQVKGSVRLPKGTNSVTAVQNLRGRG